MAEGVWFDPATGTKAGSQILIRFVQEQKAIFLLLVYGEKFHGRTICDLAHFVNFESGSYERVVKRRWIRVIHYGGMREQDASCQIQFWHHRMRERYNHVLEIFRRAVSISGKLYNIFGQLHRLVIGLSQKEKTTLYRCYEDERAIIPCKFVEL